MLEGTINPAKGESMTDQEAPERVHVTADDIEERGMGYRAGRSLLHAAQHLECYRL